MDRAALAHLDKSTTLTPAVANCMRSLECLFNDSEFQMFTTFVDINAAPMRTLPDLLSSCHHRRGVLHPHGRWTLSDNNDTHRSPHTFN